jgi:prepilin-type N-terminal cleavage/methylation domain-containing protein
MNRAMAASSPVRNDRGFALIEVIVAAAVLAMVALAVLSGIDGATSSSGRERARAVAASLAEQDQERLRGLQIDELSKYAPTSRTVTVDGVDYTVASRTKWVQDGNPTGTPGCVGGDKQSDYIYITSEVTSQGVGARIPAVKVESIVAPPIKYSTATGTLAVQVNDRNGTGVPNLSVSAAGTSTGTTSATRTTNAAGCALFEYIPAGDYDVTLSRPGWVDVKGNSVSTVSQKVTAGALNQLAMIYDQAASAALTIKTYTPGTSTAVDSSSVDVSTINYSQPMRTWPQPAAGLQNTISATSLFPFKDPLGSPYSFWTGHCASENPETYNVGYWAVAGRALQTDPGGSYVRNLFQPPVNLKVSRDSSGDVPGTSQFNNVIVTATFQPAATDPGCSDTELLYPMASGSVAMLSKKTTSYDPGLPFGKWTICVLDTTPNPDKGFRLNTAYDNTAPTGQASLTDLTPGTSNPSNPFNNNVSGKTRVSSC